MAEVDGLAGPGAGKSARQAPESIGSVADFMETVKETAGKHFKCCICFSILEDPVMLPCNHPLCRGCAMQCFKESQRCPQCMTPIPNLRMLQGRNKWIVQMVGTLKSCLDHVGVSLTQHAPVPSKYRDKPPPQSGAAGKAARERARARARASSGEAGLPSASCGGGGGGSGGGSRDRGKARHRRRANGGASRGGAAATPAAFTEVAPTSSAWPNDDDDDDDDDDGAIAPSPPPPPPPPPPQQPFVIGDLVLVEPRTWPGMNKHGGVGLVVAVLDPPGSCYDVKYTVGNKTDRGIEARFVHSHAFPEETVGSRSRRGGAGDTRARRRSGGRGGGSGSGSGSVSPRGRSPMIGPAAAAAAAADGAKPAGSSSSGVVVYGSTAGATLLPQRSPPRTPVRDSGGAARNREDGPERDQAPGVTAPVALAATAAASARASSALVDSPPAGTGDNSDSAVSRGEEGRGTDAQHRGSGGDEAHSHDDARGDSCHSDTASSSDNGGGEGLGEDYFDNGHDVDDEISDDDEESDSDYEDPNHTALHPREKVEEDCEQEEDGRGREEGEKGERVEGGDGSEANPVALLLSPSESEGEQEEVERRKTYVNSSSGRAAPLSPAGSITGGPTEEIAPPLSPTSRPNLPRRSRGAAGPDGAAKHGRRDPPLPPPPPLSSDCGVGDPTTLASAAEGLVALASTGNSGGGTCTCTPAAGDVQEDAEEDSRMDDIGVVDDGGGEADTPTTRPVSRLAPRNGPSLGQTSGSGGRQLAPVAEGRPVSLAAAAAAPAALETAEALLSMSPSVRHGGGFLEHHRDGGAPPARPTTSVSRRDGDGDDMAAAAGGCGGGSKPSVPPTEAEAKEEEGGACGDPVGTPNSTASSSRRLGPGSPSSATDLLRTTRRAMPPPPPSYRSPALARPPNASPSSSTSTPPPPAPLPSRTPPPPPPPPPPHTARRPATPSFKAGDLVSVPSRSSPGVNKEGGVAKVTLVRPDGTCDVKYIVHHGREKGVPAGIISFYAVDDDDKESSSAGSGGDGRRERGGGGGWGAVAAGSSGSLSRSSPPASKEVPPRPSSSRVRRTSRKGWCSPDLAAGQANAACLSYLLGETQHPELDLDPDLGELLDPDEGSSGAGSAGGGKVDESRREDGASLAAAPAATAAEDEAKEGDDDVTVVASSRGVGSSGGEGRQGGSKGVVGKRKRMARGGGGGGGGGGDDDTTRGDKGRNRPQASDGVEGGPSQGQGRRRRRRRSSSASESTEGMNVFDISALSAGSNSGDSSMALLTTTAPLDSEGRGGGGGVGSHDVFDFTALSDETDNGDKAAAPLPAAVVDSDSRGSGGGGSGSRSRGRAAAPPTAAVKKRCRPPGSESAEVDGRPATSGNGKSKTAKAGGSSSCGGGGGRSGDDGGGGGLQGASANGRHGRATSAAVAEEEGGAVVLTMSGSTSEMSKLADSLAKSLGWRVEPKYTEAVTHVVCGTVPKTAKARVRSVKFLRAVAGGKWVVTEAWLQECRRRRCRAEEEAFEVAGDKKSHVPSAPTRSRLAHADVDRPGLFQGITFHFRGEFGTTGSPPLSELRSMLLANAGKVVNTLGSLCGTRSTALGPGGGGGGGGGGSGGWRPRRVVIFQPSSPDEDERVLEEKKLAAALAATEAELSRQGSEESAPRGGGGGVCGRGDEVVGVDVVRPIWLVDSVGCYRVLKPAVHHRVPGFGLE